MRQQKLLSTDVLQRAAGMLLSARTAYGDGSPAAMHLHRGAETRFGERQCQNRELDSAMDDVAIGGPQCEDRRRDWGTLRSAHCRVVQQRVWRQLP